MDVDKKPLTSIIYGNNSRTGEGASYNPKVVKKMLSQKSARIQTESASSYDNYKNLCANKLDALKNGKTEEDAKISSEIAQTLKEYKSVEAQKAETDKQQEYYAENPEVFSQLFAIQESVRNGDEDNKASVISKASNGELYLNVELQMEGSPIGFSLRDGKVTFGDNEVSPDQMKEVMDFLYMRGISNFDLPKGADPKIADSFSEAKEQFDSEQVEDDISRPSGMVGAGKDDDMPMDKDEHLSPTEKWEKEQAEAIALGKGNHAGSSVEVGDSNMDEQSQPQQQPQPQPQQESAPKETGFKKAEKELADWFEKGMKKKSEYTYFKRAGSVMLGNGGWTVFSSYENGNEDNMKLDGKRDKKGNVNSTYEYRIYVRPDKSGKGIDVGYAMPKGKKVSEDVADEVLDLYKSQGVTHVNLSKMSYADAAEFRKACGRKLVVPTGTGLDKRKVSQIIEAAKDRGSEEEILKFKYQLAVQMEKNAAKKKGGKLNATDAEFAQDLKDEYQYAPFRKQYDNGMRKAMEDVISGYEEGENGNRTKVEPTADKVIGAGRALAKAYALYEQDPSWENILNPEKTPLSPKALANLNEKLSTLKAEDKDKINTGSMRDFTGFQMALIYKAMIPEEQKQAKKDLDGAFDENNKLPKSQQETRHDITRRLVQDARDEVNEVSNLLENKNIKKLYIPSFKQPKYNFGNADNSNNGNPNNNGGRS